MDGGAWQAMVHGTTKNRTWLSEHATHERAQCRWPCCLPLPESQPMQTSSVNTWPIRTAFQETGNEVETETFFPTGKVWYSRWHCSEGLTDNREGLCEGRQNRGRSTVSAGKQDSRPSAGGVSIHASEPFQKPCRIPTLEFQEKILHDDSKDPLISFSSAQFSRSVLSDSLWPYESQHARPPCPPPTPGVYSNPCPSSGWCHPTTSSSVVPFSSCPQSLPASGSFQMSQLFASGGQSTGVWASASVLPTNTQDWSPLGWALSSLTVSKLASLTCHHVLVCQRMN